MKISIEKLDKIIDLFCIVGSSEGKDFSVWGMDTELFATRQGARMAILQIIEKRDVNGK